jgi:hypothetical protein
LRPFLSKVVLSLVGSGLVVFALMLTIRLFWRRRKAAEEI